MMSLRSWKRNHGDTKKGIREIHFENRSIGEGHPCFVIAELGVNHNGDLQIAKEMISAARECGVDAVKIQSFRADDFVTDAELLYEYKSQGRIVHESQHVMFKRLELRVEWHQHLFNYAKKEGVILFSTPASSFFVDLLDDLGCPLFKMGSDDLTNIDLIKTIASKGKPIIISTGMASVEDVGEAVEAIHSTGNDSYAILQCSSMYPANFEYVNLNVMHTYMEMFDGVVGYSDHTQGSLAVLSAVAMGAKIIEKHFTLDRSMAGPDHWFSSDPNELKFLMEGIRDVEKLQGSNEKKVTKAERQNYIDCHRSVFADRDICKGEVITGDMLALKRPFTGIKPKDMDKIIGKKSNQIILKNESVKWEAIDKFS